MKRIIAFLAIVVILFGIYWFFFKSSPHDSGPKQAPIALKKHTEHFNNSISTMMSAYYDIKNAFVEDDTALVKKNTSVFIILLDSIPLEELKKDTASIYETAKGNLADIRSNAASLMQQPNITEMRHDFSMVTEMMYPSFFRTINYEGPSLYLQNCPMAFGEDNGPLRRNKRFNQNKLTAGRSTFP